MRGMGLSQVGNKDLLYSCEHPILSYLRCKLNDRHSLIGRLTNSGKYVVYMSERVLQ